VPEVKRAWEMLVSTAGRLEVSRLAGEVGYSRRHLAALFHRELGLAPKAAARVLRFERSRRLIAGPERPNLALVAAAAGYYDQAHMTREWTEIAGCAPSVWMAEELPFLQDELIDPEES
jgi:transcriptional regulator GlxA family with amidase domain